MKKIALFLLGLGSLFAVNMMAETPSHNTPAPQQQEQPVPCYNNGTVANQLPCNQEPCDPAPCVPDTVCNPAPCNPAPCNPAPCNPGC